MSNISLTFQIFQLYINKIYFLVISCQSADQNLIMIDNFSTIFIPCGHRGYFFLMILLHNNNVYYHIVRKEVFSRIFFAINIFYR